MINNFLKYIKKELINNILIINEIQEKNGRIINIESSGIIYDIIENENKFSIYIKDINEYNITEKHKLSDIGIIDIILLIQTNEIQLVKNDKHDNQIYYYAKRA